MDRVGGVAYIKELGIYHLACPAHLLSASSPSRTSFVDAPPTASPVRLAGALLWAYDDSFLRLYLLDLFGFLGSVH